MRRSIVLQVDGDPTSVVITVALWVQVATNRRAAVAAAFTESQVPEAAPFARTAEETTQLLAGAVREVVQTFAFPMSLPRADMMAQIEAAWDQLQKSETELRQLQRQLGLSWDGSQWTPPAGS